MEKWGAWTHYYCANLWCHISGKRCIMDTVPVAFHYQLEILIKYSLFSTLWNISCHRNLTSQFGELGHIDLLPNSWYFSAGIILRPGFIHGTRQVGSMKLPLGVIGAPLEMVIFWIIKCSYLYIIFWSRSRISIFERLDIRNFDVSLGSMCMNSPIIIWSPSCNARYP